VKPVPDRLYENLGDGRFRDALASAGLDREPGRGQGVVAADLDRDGLIDLYVSNDANPNFLFRNLGDGKFEDLSDVSGTASDYAGRLQAGMGVDVADVDRDGWWDLFVTNYEGEYNAFYKNLGANLFQDVSQSQGLAAPSLRWVGWGTSFDDFDLDGWSDLIVTNGHTDNNLHEMGRDSEYRQPALLFHNDGGRLKQVLTGDGYFGGTHPGRALCAADLDRDADLDLIIGHQDEPPAVLRNDAERAETRRVISLKLIGTSSNRDGIGATVEALGVEPSLTAQWKSGASYLAAFPHEAVLSLPADDTVELQIRWPGGRVDRRGAPIHPGRYALVEGGELLLLESFNHSERATHEY
jgi:hypothetical protein